MFLFANIFCVPNITLTPPSGKWDFFRDTTAQFTTTYHKVGFFEAPGASCARRCVPVWGSSKISPLSTSSAGARRRRTGWSLHGYYGAYYTGGSGRNRGVSAISSVTPILRLLELGATS